MKADVLRISSIMFDESFAAEKTPKHCFMKASPQKK